MQCARSIAKVEDGENEEEDEEEEEEEKGARGISHRVTELLLAILRNAPNIFARRFFY